MEPRSRPGVWQAATPRLAHDLRLPFLEAHFPPTIHHDGGLSRREAVHRRRSALPPSCSCYAYPRSHPSETAPLLQDVDHPDADSRPQHSSFTSIIQEPLTSLTKVLLVVALHCSSCCSVPSSSACSPVRNTSSTPVAAKSRLSRSPLRYITLLLPPRHRHRHKRRRLHPPLSQRAQ